jgi:hypothetical protein
MRLRTKAWLEFGAFCAIFAALIVMHQHYHALDHWMALIWLSFLVVGGLFALIRIPSGTSRRSIGFLNALPRSWQRWFLGEGGDDRDRRFKTLKRP